MWLDFKLGIVWSFLVALIFDQEISWLWCAAGIAFALLPDLDFIIEYVRRGTVGGKVIDAHRTWLHNPLTYIPIALLIANEFGPAWFLLFALGVGGHFVHDLAGMGYGIRLWWPFSTRWHKFFSAKDGSIYYDFNHFFTSWSDVEMQELVARRGNDSWLQEDIAYMKKHWLRIVGALFALVLTIALLIVVLPI